MVLSCHIFALNFQFFSLTSTKRDLFLEKILFLYLSSIDPATNHIIASSSYLSPTLNFPQIFTLLNTLKSILKDDFLWFCNFWSFLELWKYVVYPKLSQLLEYRVAHNFRNDLDFRKKSWWEVWNGFYCVYHI